MIQSQPPTTSASATLTLTIELADLTLALAIRLTYLSAASSPATQPCLHPLAVLPRTVLPLTNKCTLVHCPHVDLDTATKLCDLDLLQFMLNWSKDPKGRPVHYTASRVLLLAMERGWVAGLDWWLNQSRLHVHCGIFLVHWLLDNASRVRKGKDPVKEVDMLHVLEWWNVHCGLDGLQEWSDGSVSLVAFASANGHVHVLECLLVHLGPEHVTDRWGQGCSRWPYHREFGKSVGRTVLGQAARNGHVHGLDWWWTKAQAGDDAAVLG